MSRSLHRTSTALAGVTILTATILAAVPAQAATQRSHDARGDVMVLDDPEGGYTPAPADRTSDILRSTFRHERKRLVVTLKVADLARGSNPMTVVEVRRPGSGVFTVTHALYGGTKSLTLTKGSRTVKCKGLRARFNYSTDFSTVSVPTSCLGNPRRVRVGAGQARVSDDFAVYADDARRRGINEDSEHLTFGPWLRRG